MSPTATTCVATSSSRPPSSRPDGTSQRSPLAVRTDGGDHVTCRFYVMASGCLSVPKAPDIEGADRFAGEVYFTGRWPHEGVDFTGKRVAVVGTGSSGIQSIPLIAAQADQLTVFQRTPNFSIPARNGPPSPERLAALETDRAAYRRGGRRSRGGVPYEVTEVLGSHGAGRSAPGALRGRLGSPASCSTSSGVFTDQIFNPVSNEVVAEMIREKIRDVVEDPETAETLCPTDYPFGTKRPCLDTGYFATFNLPHVRLVDLRREPDRHHHRVGHRHRGRVVRLRRHRLRHRVRRHDRRHRRRRHHRPGRRRP